MTHHSFRPHATCSRRALAAVILIGLVIAVLVTGNINGLILLLIEKLIDYLLKSPGG